MFKDTTIKLQHFINLGLWTDEKILPFILTVLPGQIWPKACCCGVPEDAIQGTDREWKRSRFEAHGWLLLRAGTSGPSALARGAAEGSARALVQVRRSITRIHRSCQETDLTAVFLSELMHESCTIWGYLWSNMDSWPCSPTVPEWRRDNSSTPFFFCSSAFTSTGLFKLRNVVTCPRGVLFYLIVKAAYGDAPTGILPSANQFPLNSFLLCLHASPPDWLLSQLFLAFRRSKYDILMEYVSNFLQRSPGQVASIITLKAQLVSLSVDVWCLVRFTAKFP